MNPLFGIGSVVGSYRVVGALGKGGMGEVYEVEHVRLGTHYALKAFTLDHGDVDLLRERFVAEGKVLARLSHPNLVRVFELDHDAATGTLYFVMDLVRGARSFMDLEDAPAEEAELARWFGQLAAALDYIHGEGIVHRDIKPSNILVDEKGDVRLVDFGVSRYVSDAVRQELAISQRQQNGEWRSGTFNMKMGTGDFMAPEVRAGKPATAASDAYSLGLVFFRQLTGVWYEPGRNPFRLLEPLELGWRAVLEPLLRRNPEERPATLTALASRLDDALPELPNEPPVKSSWRVALWTVLSAGILIASVWPIAMKSVRDRESPSSVESAPERSAVSTNTVPVPALIVLTNSVRATAPVTNIVEVPRTVSVTNIAEQPTEVPVPDDECPLFGHDIDDFEIGGGEKIRLVWCPPGAFDMGSSSEEDGRFQNETPHRVRIARGFWMAERETTQGQWKRLFENMSIVDLARAALLSPEPDDLDSGNGESAQWAGTRGWSISKSSDPEKRCGDEDDALPVYYVSWQQATNFCARLTSFVRSEQDWLPDGYEFRLPTEAEWEYACRAGSSTGLPGNRKMRLFAGSKNYCPALDDYAWFGGNSCNDFHGRGFDVSDWPGRMYPGTRAAPHRGGRRKPNEWGLCDMLGNVWEWCNDWYGPYDPCQTTDPKGPDHGQYRVVRGGSWMTTARQTRAAYREGLPNGLGNFIGFRVVLGPKIE